jgi:arginine exporter protein ArgO
MEDNRKIIIVGGVVFMFLMGFVALAAIALNPWDKLRSFGVGVVTGAGVAILMSWYILRVWDPVNLRLKVSQTNNNNVGCWLPIVAIGSVILGRLLSSYFAISLMDLFVGCILSAATLTLSFLACLAWWYRPR